MEKEKGNGSVSHCEGCVILDVRLKELAEYNTQLLQKNIVLEDKLETIYEHNVEVAVLEAKVEALDGIIDKLLRDPMTWYRKPRCSAGLHGWIYRPLSRSCVRCRGISIPIFRDCAERGCLSC